jgi:hypothetical protein
MYRRIDEKLVPAPKARTVTFTFDGEPMVGFEGETIAASLLNNGVTSNRSTPVSGAPRAPYCMMGVCFECLVVINGVGNRQGCLVPIEDGMIVESQKGRRQLAPVPEKS